MRWRMLLLLVLLASTAQAARHVLAHDQHVLTRSSTDGTIPTTSVEVWERHDWRVQARNATAHIQAHYVLDGSSIQARNANFALYWDGAPAPSCVWRVEAPNAGTAARVHSMAVRCSGINATAGPHTVEVRRTAVTGAPITNATISIHLETVEVVTMEIGINTTLDSFLPVLAWLAYAVLLHVIREKTVRVVGVFAGFAALALPMDGTQFLVLLAAQVALTIMVLLTLFRK